MQQRSSGPAVFYHRHRCTFVDMHRLMFLVPLLHARAEKTDPVTRMLSEPSETQRKCVKSYLQRQIRV